MRKEKIDIMIQSVGEHKRIEETAEQRRSDRVALAIDSRPSPVVDHY